ncbi:GNAT family N-acetyltransferase [Photobacterium alginatilyticum]|uniref:GNAT family N-acetyltransferase n=1 Tax=Photobacterium alginatilyticum TaxID=1775171 RepID=A0ABW9YHB9_9GAMM|nr:GNAT family N-acetyltransferase [Photobacterium alginatilyticum]NBI53219.1 GNAT family N-acetyltransferase [Photobacterium alginatilyticum]
MLTLKIREFAPEDSIEDKGALLPVFLSIWNAPENLKYLSSTLIPFESEQVEGWFDNHKALGGRYFCALDEQDNILGVMVVKVNTKEGFELYGLGVLPAHKGNGVGIQLVEHAARVARGLGFHDIKALVFADNTGMLCLLLKSGYISVGMEYHKRSDGADAVTLCKRLSGSQ